MRLHSKPPNARVRLIALPLLAQWWGPQDLRCGDSSDDLPPLGPVPTCPHLSQGIRAFMGTALEFEPHWRAEVQAAVEHEVPLVRRVAGED